jgi:hypothetical protein
MIDQIGTVVGISLVGIIVYLVLEDVVKRHITKK